MDAMNALFDFVAKQCLVHNIDESHGLIHTKRCITWVNRLLDDTFSEEETNMAIYAVALHDMVDKKYTNGTTTHIQDWLTQQGWSEEHITILLQMISTMSYSYVTTHGLPDYGSWNRVYHVIRHADLLDAYQVSRCALYNRRIHPDWTEDQCWEAVSSLFEKRVFRYVSDGWITLQKALVFVPLLEEKARFDLLHRIDRFDEIV